MAAAALRVPLALPPCPDCRGGGEINGVECRECEGRGRAGVRHRRWTWRRLLDGAATPAGAVVGTLLGWSRTVPGVGGAAAVTYGLAVFVHSAWHWVPVYAVVLAVGGAFGLMMDRRL